VPLVNANPSIDRLAWGVDTLSLALLQSIEPSKQIRLARFLRNLDARIVAAASIIARSSLQMTTIEGLTPLLSFELILDLAWRTLLDRSTYILYQYYLEVLDRDRFPMATILGWDLYVKVKSLLDNVFSDFKR